MPYYVYRYNRIPELFEIFAQVIFSAMAHLYDFCSRFVAK